MMNLITRQDGAMLVIAVDARRIDASVAIEFKDRMRALSAGGAERILLDLAQVEFIDSSGLGAIVASMKQLADGQVLELAALSENVGKVFRLTRMDTVFTIHTSTSGALGGTSLAS